MYIYNLHIMYIQYTIHVENCLYHLLSIMYFHIRMVLLNGLNTDSIHIESDYFETFHGPKFQLGLNIYKLLVRISIINQKSILYMHAYVDLCCTNNWNFILSSKVFVCTKFARDRRWKNSHKVSTVVSCMYNCTMYIITSPAIVQKE